MPVPRPSVSGRQRAGPVDPALSVVDLVKTYGSHTAVDGLSFDVRPGTVLALLGPNGAGKTSTVEVCEGFRSADGGQVRVLGLDPLRDRATVTARVGVMLQSGGVPQGARAGELLAVVAAFYAHPWPAGELLDLLGLAEVARVPYRRLSGGQQQRLSLALALVGRPELVFLDEPTAGLDPQARRATWDIVGRLRADGVTVLLTTHYLEEAERLADQVLIIDRGRAVAAGTPAELTASTSAGTLRFRTDRPVDTAALAAALPGAVSLTETPHGYAISGAGDPYLLAALTAWCAEHNVRADDLSLSARTLEDVFLDLTGRELRS